MSEEDRKLEVASLEAVSLSEVASFSDDDDLPVPDSPGQDGDGATVETKTSEDELPTPPDGEWGWVIVVASFFIHVIADGVAYSFGVFLEDFSVYFNAGHGSTSLLGSLMIGVTWGSGPIVSALTNVFGCRFTTILGSFLASFGFIISLFAPNIYFMYFSFGIVSGLGLGLIFVPAIVSVTFYFEKRRSFATGLAVCGSGIGTFIFGPLTEVLLQYYGSWKAAVLIEAALILNCAVCGALFRPLIWKKPKNAGLAELESNDNLEDDRIELTEKKSSMSNGQPTQIKSSPDLVRPKNIPPYLRSVSSSSLPHHINTSKDEKGAIAALKAQNYASDFCIHKASSGSPSVVHHRKHHHHPHVGPLARKDIFYSGSLKNIPLYNANPKEYTRSITSIPDVPDDAVSIASETFVRKIQSFFTCKIGWREVLDFTVFKDLVFILFIISNFLTSLGFCIPYVFLPDRAKLLGCSRAQGAFLISIIGISNTIGRVVFGFISDRKGVNRLMLYNTVLTLCGISTMASSLCVTFPLLCLYAGLFGCFLGVYVSITSVVLVDLMGLDKLTSSFGLTLMFQGIAAVLGPPIAGWVYDATHNYDLSFYLMGAMITISGLMLYPIPRVQRYVQDKQDRKDLALGKKPSSHHQNKKAVVLLEEEII